MKTLVIVESPTKAKTISKFLGKDFSVESSFGHVRDLPKGKMGVDIEGGTFEPHYVIPKERTAQVKKLKDVAKKCDSIIFATDEDREGEAISWHLAHILDIKPGDAKRMVFHEITKHAIDEALKRPRPLDLKLVDAQQARRVLDRLVGYELSPFLWKKVARGLSAGRVQSVAVRLVVEREREIQQFKTEEYWTLAGVFSPEQKKELSFIGNLHSIDNKKVDKFDLKTKESVGTIVADLDNASYTISNIEKSEVKRTPPPPFTTSTLQQSSNQKLGYSSKQTMRLAQQLYEGVELGTGGSVGLITYMRTDSVNLSDKFVQETREHISKEYGEKYALSTPRLFKTKSKGAQEAHEAIRPSDPSRTPDSVKLYLDPQQHKLYSLIWKRAVATQMAEAKLNKTTIEITAKQYTFRTVGQTILFDGWLKLYPDSMKEDMLPDMNQGDKVECKELKPEQHFTEPPSRYSDATLVKVMEAFGIGRPSTYAPTIGTIEDRGYVERDENKRLKPKDIAFLVNDLLVQHFSNIVDFSFTAQMEENLDEIAEGKKDWKPIIATFYSPFHELILKKTDELSKADTMGTRELGNDPASGKPISVRMGRFGPFVQKGSKDDEEKPKFASLRKDQSIQTVTLEDALLLFTLPRTLGTDTDGNEIITNIGRFGPYVKVGSTFYSVKDKDPYTITLEEAREVIKQLQEQKAHKTIKEFEGSEVKILNGRYGPYITDGKINAKIPKDRTPESLTKEECEILLKESPSKKRGGWKRKTKTK